MPCPGAQDLIALLVFLVVAILIGAMLSTAISRGARAERRAQETEILHLVATQLLRGEPIEPVLQRFAGSVVELLGLARLEISTDHVADRIITEEAVPADGREETFSMLVRGASIGHLRVTPARHTDLGSEERAALVLFADQLALALDTVGLASQVRHAELEAGANRARAALFSSVTHDLRTPLASILASATTLRSGDGLQPDDRHELLDALCDEAERLNRLVGNLLDLSRMRAGSLTPVKVKTPVDELVFGVLGRMERELADHPLDVRIAPDLPEVRMDVVQMDQVLTNLLENAARFAPAGSPITLVAKRSDGVVRLCVSDRGPGIPPEERERVFEPFVRLSPSGGGGAPLARASAWPSAVRSSRRTGEESGSTRRRGPGRASLWISRWRSHDGDARAGRRRRSADPARLADEPAHPGVRRVGGAERRDGDRPSHQDVRRSRDSRPRLPGKDGHEVIRRLRSWSSVPVIVLSVREDQANKIAALDAGADDYVTRPFAIEELLARIRSVRRRLVPEPEPLVLRFDDLDIDLARHLVRLAGEPVHLTPTEYALLEALARNPGKLLTHRWLLEKVWGPAYANESHYVRVFIQQLRRKLGDDASRPKWIVTETGLGYRWRSNGGGTSGERLPH